MPQGSGGEGGSEAKRRRAGPFIRVVLQDVSRNSNAYGRRASVFDIANDNEKALSPILFVDGHAKMHDFTKALHDDWRYPTEATKDWIWYQPVTGTNGLPVPRL